MKNRVYGPRIVTFAPLYCSNLCVNSCLYCAFRRENAAEQRRQLTIAEVRQETEALVSVGHKRVIVVYGEHPDADLDYILETIRAIYDTKVGNGEIAVLVVPIDKEAPKGRLILPQQQAIRDLLEADSYCVVVKDREFRRALESLRRPPRLVVTDSQAFLKVAADTPRDVPLTSFSILYARFKGDLLEQVLGTLAAEDLRSGDRVLIAEACSHHPIGEDIGRVKIPRWLRQLTSGRLTVETVQGHDFPEDLSPYGLVVHCGACMWNRREMLSRILRCREQGVPISNYGLIIAYSLGIFERALKPFPGVLEAYQAARKEFYRNRHPKQVLPSVTGSRHQLSPPRERR